MALVLPPNADVVSQPMSPLMSDSVPSFQVPNVFVIPPEEEQADTPPYCCFDAAAPIEEESYVFTDMESLDAALNLVHSRSSSSPIFHRPYESDWEHDVAMPRRADGSRGQSQLAQQWEDAVKEARRYYETGEDSEIVEVIKVRKNEGMSDIFDGRLEDEIVRRSKEKGLRSRASQAFRSIKNIGKTSRKLRAQNAFAPSEEYRSSIESSTTTVRSENCSGAVNAPRLETSEGRPRKLLRRKSRAMSSIFTLSQGNRSTANVASPDVPDDSVSPVDHEAESRMTPSSSTGSSSSFSGPGSLGPSAGDSELGANLAPPENLIPRSVSPTLSIKRSFRKRLSILSLNRIFTSSSPESTDEPSIPRPAPAPYPIPILSPDSRSVQFSPCPTESSSDALDTPTDDVYQSPTLPSMSLSGGSLDLSPLGIVVVQSDSESTGTMPTSGSMTTQSSKTSSSRPQSGEEVEMRLDSIHFDSLHFDAEEFNISLS